METTESVYIPEGGITLDKMEVPQFRLLLQGPFGEGKTYAAATFPWPIFLSLDRGLGALIGDPNIVEMPFYDVKFLKEICKVNWKPGESPNKKDAILSWLQTNARKIPSKRTLILDNLTGMDTAFELEQSKYPFYTSAGKEDKYVFWRLKNEWFGEIFDILKSLDCHVVVICHEQLERNSQGDYTGKNRPLLTGQFADKVGTHVTDLFRQHCGDKKPIEKIDDKILSNWGFKTKDEYLEMQKQFVGNSIYFWQTEGDDIFNAKASSLVNAPRFIPANYNSLLKWMRKK